MDHIYSYEYLINTYLNYFIKIRTFVVTSKRKSINEGIKISVLKGLCTKKNLICK